MEIVVTYQDTQFSNINAFKYFVFKICKTYFIIKTLYTPLCVVFPYVFNNCDNYFLTHLRMTILLLFSLSFLLD